MPRHRDWVVQPGKSGMGYGSVPYRKARSVATKRAAGLTPSDLPSLAKNVLQALWRCTTLPKWVAEFNPPVGLGVCLLGAKWDTAGVRWVTTVVLFPQHHRLRHKH
jgi:hypothetical protein